MDGENEFYFEVFNGIKVPGQEFWDSKTFILSQTSFELFLDCDVPN